MDFSPLQKILRSGPALIAFDMDSTLIENEGIDELAREMGCFDEMSKLTESAMRGEIDFETSLKNRVRLLKGLPFDRVENVRKRIRPIEGAQAWMRNLESHGHKTAVLSGGFDLLVMPVIGVLGIDAFRVNYLAVENGKLTGEIRGPVVDAKGKAQGALEIAAQYSIPGDRIIAFGDGANDIELFKIATFRIGMNPKPKLRDFCDLVIEPASYLPLMRLDIS